MSGSGNESESEQLQKGVAVVSRDSTVVTPITNAEQVKLQIAQLLTALQEKLPGYESLLHTIHRALATDPDVVQVLTEEEIGTICVGLSKRTSIFIAAKEADKKVKKGGKVTLDELM